MTGYTPPQMSSDQEVYDYVLNFLDMQNKRAVGGGGLCRYRTHWAEDDGTAIVLRCAVGCLISDAEYDSMLEGEDVGECYSVIKRSIGFAPTDNMRTYDMLSTLQDLHDNTWSPVAGTFSSLVDRLYPNRELLGENQDG